MSPVPYLKIIKIIRNLFNPKSGGKCVSFHIFWNNAQLWYYYPMFKSIVAKNWKLLTKQALNLDKILVFELYVAFYDNALIWLFVLNTPQEIKLQNIQVFSIQRASNRYYTPIFKWEEIWRPKCPNMVFFPRSL